MHGPFYPWLIPAGDGTYRDSDWEMTEAYALAHYPGAKKAAVKPTLYVSIPEEPDYLAYCSTGGRHAVRRDPTQFAMRAERVATPLSRVRLLVVGGEDGLPEKAVLRPLQHLVVHRVVEAVIHGARTEADEAAGRFARRLAIPEVPMPPAPRQRLNNEYLGEWTQAMIAEGRANAVMALPGERFVPVMASVCRARQLPVWWPWRGQPKGW